MVTEQTLRDREVATIIRDQLGKTALAMIGAANLTCGNVAGRSYLEFRFKMFPKANVCRIILDPTDTYTVRFYQARKTTPKIVAEASDIYVDDLHDHIERVTGLCLRMGRVVGI